MCPHFIRKTTSQVCSCLHGYEWEDMKIQVRADVKRYGFFSAHADARETVEWLSNQDRNETNIYLIHGDKSSLDAQRDYLDEHDFLNVMIPARGEEIVIPVTGR